MPLHLTGLQPELLLTIADALGPDYTGLLDDDVQPKYDANGDRASDRDCKRKYRESESQKNILSWSCTSKYFRALLSSYVFKTVILRNDEKSGASIDVISKHPDLEYCVREIRFVGYAPGDARRKDPAFGDTEHILPQNVTHLLSNLGRFRNLETLSIEFDYDFGDYREWEEEGVNPADEVEDLEEIRRKEGQEAWRALMLKVWEAVCSNDGTVVRKLAIERLYYKEVSAFTTPVFHQFLSNLEDFSLSIYGGDNGAGWETKTCEIWSAFVAKLDEFFFDHLQRITSLTLKATEEGPIGLEGMNHASLALRPDHMPHLKIVHLEYMFLSPELRDFLVGHASTLEEVHLRSCLAETDDSMAEDGLHWHELFDAISSARPSKLQIFKVTQERPASLPESKRGYDKFDSKVQDENETTLNAEIEQARETAEAREKRVWPHVTVDDKYGMLFEDEEENFLSFREGRDQEAFERLMSIVEGNAGGNEMLVDVRDSRGPKPQEW